MHRHAAIIIGAGPGGLCAGIRLAESGRSDFLILEQASGLGGTWYHNRYPGAACDVPSHLYSFSFDRRLDWPRPYSPQTEILAYLEQVAAEHGLLPHIRFDRKVEGAEWIEEVGLWRVRDTSGETYEASVLFSAMGMFNEIHVPAIPGLETFAGNRFHSARWPTDHDLTGERVAVIGSAASAVQLVPEVAKRAARLDLYQRTANWVLPKEDLPFTRDRIAEIQANPSIAEDLRRDGFDLIESLITYDQPDVMEAAAQAGRDALLVVEDPEVRRKLEPQHPYGCKRALLSNDFYPTFNRANVDLVTEPIDHVETRGVVTEDGRLREADTLILATGFQTTRFLAAIDVRGRGGVRIDALWQDGAYAFLGSMVPGFPNLFMMYGPNTNNGSIIEMIEHQVAFAIRQLDRMDREGLASIEPTHAATDAYNERLQRQIDGIEVWQAACPGYYRAASGRIVTQWPLGMRAYAQQMSEIDPADYYVEARRD